MGPWCWLWSLVPALLIHRRGALRARCRSAADPGTRHKNLGKNNANSDNLNFLTRGKGSENGLWTESSGSTKYQPESSRLDPFGGQKNFCLERLVNEKLLYFYSRWTGSDRHPAEKTSPQCAAPPKSSGTDFGKIESLMELSKIMIMIMIVAMAMAIDLGNG